ncbi:penicillin-binding protein [Pyxidicoccus fallax]|uniref:Penicillin-binding protein n=1 Tax=Pyxidicoccus fallax TaxID=394095 RepID=A0A848LJ56_9BACT|nr:penicillin-binding transpeptidase domain-containing protein [Pyxidicoccus fallax]NMO17752.1 penicillin-binding protein [Pyxidicoccus fallax]NPC78225.1 penicillin-binding protein [Pyxidicoccus fallax]
MTIRRRLLSAAALFPLTLLLGANAPVPGVATDGSATSGTGGAGKATTEAASQTQASTTDGATPADSSTTAEGTATQGQPASGMTGVGNAASSGAASDGDLPSGSESAGSATAQQASSDAGTPESHATAAAAVLGGAPDGGLAVLAAEPGMVPPAPVPSREKAPPFDKLQPLPRAADVLARAKLEGERLVVKEKDGRKQVLTIDPVLQASLTNIMRSYEVPYGAAVVLEPSTGRVLAMAEHSAARPDLRGLPVRAVFPAASIFKIVTGGALLEAGVPPSVEECFHGGKRRLSEKHLEDSERDGACYSLALAMGKSANVVFAKLTNKHLDADALRRMAARFRFNREIPFAVPTDISLAAIPEESFGLANTGAGFGDVYLSPLHGALVASVAANDGRWVDPVLFEPEGRPLLPPEGEPVLTPEAAKDLTDMLEETVTRGTARGVFRERGFRVENAVGKTGTLADREPFRDYSWFVGFAPKDNPRVAVAAVIVNDPKWRIRGTWLGREALRLGLERVPAPVELTAPASAAGKH